MYKLFNKIDNVDSFSVYKDNLLYYSNIVLFLNQKELKLDDDLVIGGYLDNKGILNITTVNKVYYYASVGERFLFAAEHMKGFFNIEVEENVQLKRSNNSHYSLFSIVENRELREYPSNIVENYPLAYKKEVLFFQEFPKPVVNSFSLLSGNYVWEVDLTEIGRFTDHRGETHEGQIEHILGIWQDTLWVWLKGYQCVGIHTDTGQITHHWLPFQTLFKPGHFFLNFPHFDAHTGQIHFFERSYFIQIDLATQHSQILWQDKAYEINASRVDQDYIYFIGAQPDSVYSTVVGVFDRQANAVVWTDTIDLPPFVTLNQAPVVGADKLYVLDSGGTLRIYQRQA